MLDLLLVNPGNRAQAYGELGGRLSGIEPPFWCGLLAGFIRKHGYSVKIIDADAQNLSPEDTAEAIAESNPLVAAIIVLGTNPSASSTPKMTAAGQTLKVLKKRNTGIKTVLGGLHPSALPERTLGEEDVDFVCRGEGFHTLLQLLEKLKSEQDPKEADIDGLCYIRDGQVRLNPLPPAIENLDKLPFVAWDMLPMDKYRAHNWHCFEDLDKRQPYAVVYTSLGCPFRCSYCPVHALYGEPGIRFRSPEKVVEEIDLLVKNYNLRNIKIMDELFVLKESRVLRFCDLIIQRGYKLNMWAYARVDTVNQALLKRMKQAGINWICYGIESVAEAVRLGVAKRIKQDKIKRAIEMTRDAGIYILGNFMFGLPDDDLESMRKNLDTAKELNCEYVNFYVAMAYPGSQLYQQALERKIDLPRQWSGFGQYSQEALPLPTKHLSAAEVLRFRDKAFVEYLTDPRYLKSIEDKFGHKVVEHIGGILEYKIHRKFA